MQSYFDYCPIYFTNYMHTLLASAQIIGGPLAPQLTGIVTFKNIPGGTEVYVDVKGLPPYKPAQNGTPPIGPHGFHIHENGDCQTGDSNDPLKSAGAHWNPTNQPHGNHAGDFPALFSNHGVSHMCFFTDKFKVEDIVGKSIIIHENPDDYSTQPSGASGKRLACGVIKLFT